MAGPQKDTGSEMKASSAEEYPAKDALFEWLSEPCRLGIDPKTAKLKRFSGGYSNLTFLLTATAKSDKSEQKWVVRFPPKGSRGGSAHNMEREFSLLSQIHDVFPKSPRAVLCCEDKEVAGAPFMIMEYQSGLILRPGGECPFKRKIDSALYYHKTGNQAVEMLAELHSIPTEKLNMPGGGDPETYTKRQVENWIRRFKNALTDDVHFPEYVAELLTEYAPEKNEVTLIHNDFKLDNIVLEPESPYRVKSLLDWEMATLGDPMSDLGTTLAYWVEAEDFRVLRPLGVTYRKGNLSRDEFAKKYAKLTGREIGQLNYYLAFGYFKIAVIVQQIYYRYKKGYTNDPRFAELNHVVDALLLKASGYTDTFLPLD